jgi:hypothetical protein
MVSDNSKRHLHRFSAVTVARAFLDTLLFGLLMAFLLLSILGHTNNTVKLIPGLSPIMGYLDDMRYAVIGALAIAIIGILFVTYNRGRLFPHPASISYPNAFLSSSLRRCFDYLSTRYQWIFLPPLLVGAFLYYYRGIDVLDFSNDEFQVIDTAYGYLKTGFFMKWDFCASKIGRIEYLRAFPHTWLVAQAIDLLGMSEWSTRLVSVVFGVSLVCIGYFVADYFIKNGIFSFVAACCLILHPFLSDLFKITRMYSMMAPFFLGTLFCVHKLFLILDDEGFGMLRKPLNLLLLLALPVLVGFNALIHINSLTILPYMLFFAVAMALFTRKSVFIWLVGLGLAACGIIYLISVNFGFLSILTNHMSVFESSNYNYIADLITFPFGFPVGLGLMLLSLVLIFFLKDRLVRIHILSLFSVTAVGVVFFVFIANRYYASKYISFLMPVSVIWIVFSFYLVTRLFKSRWKRILLFLAATSNIAMPLFQMKPVVKSIDYKTAYATIEANYEPEKKEIIAGQYLRCYYLRGIGNRASLFSLRRRQEVTYGAFMNKIKQTTAGWVTWATQKEGHIRRKIRRTANHCFDKYHGTGVDDTGVEVFYYHQDMPCIRRTRRIPRQFDFLVIDGAASDNTTMGSPGAADDDTQVEEKESKRKNRPKYIEMDFSSPFTVAFWVKSKTETPGAPVSFGSSYLESIMVESRRDFEKGGFRFRYSAKGPCSVLSTGKINDNTWHWLALYQEGGKPGDEIGIYVDGSVLEICSLETEKNVSARFLTNVFNGYVQDIRIYDAVLTEPQLQAIYNKGEITLDSRLTAENEIFIPRYHLVNKTVNRKHKPRE